MELSIGDRCKRAFNAFMNRAPTYSYQDLGYGYYRRPDRPILTSGNERSIVTSIFNRIALDAASITLNHCRVDPDGRFSETISSTLNDCLTLSANCDQTGRAFMHDAYMSMFDEGTVALVPVDTDTDPRVKDSYKILSLRTAKVIQWYPRHVKLRCYNDVKGIKEDILMPKSEVAIIENPFYAVMNEPNSTAKRLIRKLSLLDVTDENTASGKLDLLIHLPYSVNSPARRNQAEMRRKDIEMQLATSKYGIAYTDGTERVTQLNRPVENNLMKQVEYLTNLLFSQLGITQSIMDGTADEKTMLNYYSRTIEPIVSAVADELKLKFLTKTARTQGQTILFFRDPFKLVPINDIAEIADKFTRNEILTSNELRQIIGRKPSNDPKADKLINSNISQPSADEDFYDDRYDEET